MIDFKVIAEMCGLELYEEFDVKYPLVTCSYRFTENGLEYHGFDDEWEMADPRSLGEILQDGNTVKKKPFVPKHGESYFYIDSIAFSLEDIVSTTQNEGFDADETAIQIHNCFRTREEAEKAAERIKEVLKEIAGCE